LSQLPQEIFRYNTVPAYDEIVDGFSLDVLQEPGDLTLVGGDLALTRSGDLMLNNVEYSALFRVVQEWRYNTPTMHYLFDTAFNAQLRKQEIESAINCVFDQPYDPCTRALSPDPGRVARYHELNDEMDALKISALACASTIVMILSRMLLAMQDDMQATKDQWETSGNLIHGHSVGVVLWAAANNFRHNDEWFKTRPPTPQQLKSIRVLADALQEPIAENGDGHQLHRDICYEILELLSNGDFNKLGMVVLSFANAFAKRCMQDRKASPI
jgi:hypothetical protein